MRRLNWVGVFVAACLVVAVLGASIMLNNSAGRSEKAYERSRIALERALGAQRQASVGTEIAEAVKGAREQSIVRSCQETNMRHRGSVEYLTKLAHQEIHEAKRGKKRRQVRKEAHRGLAEFKLLFDALAPIQNCSTLVQRETH